MKNRLVVIFVVTLTGFNLWALWRQPSSANAEATEEAPSVHHILLEVQELDRAIAFYRDQMGLALTSKSGDFATLDSANVGVYLWTRRWDWEDPPAPRPDERPGLGMYPHFAVADTKAKVEQLRKAGASIIQEPRVYNWGTEAFIADPDGYTWALVSPPER